MNIENVNLNDTEVKDAIENAISNAFEGHLERLDISCGYDFGINWEDVLEAESEAFENIINYIKEL